MLRGGKRLGGRLERTAVAPIEIGIIEAPLQFANAPFEDRNLLRQGRERVLLMEAQLAFAGL